MLLSELKKSLLEIKSVNFKLPGGEYVPGHFHLTELGVIDKKFIDCGGKLRNEKKISLQLLHANDLDHRLSPGKFLKIISSAESILNAEYGLTVPSDHIGDYEVEAEYQTETTGRYALDFDGMDYLLLPTHTACLAKDHCGIPEGPVSKNKEVCCTPGGGCC